MVPICPVRHQHRAGLAVTGDLMVTAISPSAQDLLEWVEAYARHHSKVEFAM